MKLTKAQQDLLEDVYRGQNGVSDTYAPAKKLVRLGLCAWNSSRFGSTSLTLTPAGRAALEEKE